MSAGRIIGFIVAGILLFFGVIYMLGSASAGATPGWLWIGLFLTAAGIAMVFVAARKPAQTSQSSSSMKIDIPGSVKMDTLKCQSCGGTIGPEDVKMIAGAPVVTCPYCHTTYQLTEEPKW